MNRYKNIAFFLILIFFSMTPSFGKTAGDTSDFNLASEVISFDFSLEDVMELNNTNANWSKVLPGKTVFAPQETSYGFVAITDAKNIMAFSSYGKTLFTKDISKTKNPKLFVLPGDFLLFISDAGTKLTLLNPSGNSLWSKTFDSEITSKPFPGRDGRFFLISGKNLYCLDMTGKQKWVHSIPADDFSKNNFSFDFNSTENRVQELPDGSIFILNSTYLTRFSPFGMEMEKIRLKSKLKEAYTTDSGVLILLENGELCLYSDTENEKSDSDTEKYIKWKTDKVIKTAVSENTLYIIRADKPSSKNFFINKLNLSEISQISDDSFNSSVNTQPSSASYSTFQILNFDSAAKSVFTALPDGIFISNLTKGFFLSSEGQCIWSGSFPKNKGKQAWNYYFISKDYHLTFCQTNWTLDSYRIFQENHSESKKSNQKNKKSALKKDYSSYLDILTYEQFINVYDSKLDPLISSAQTKEILKDGNYGELETEIISKLYSSTNSYYKVLNTSNSGTRIEQSLFTKDHKGLTESLKLLGLFGTDTFNEHIAMILKKDRDVSNQLALLQGIITNGYDPELEILDALAVLAKKTSPNDKYTITCICDAVYSICAFMGNQAFNGKGKSILSGFLFPSYAAESRAYARNTFTKLADFNQ